MYHIKVMLMITSAGMVSLVVIKTTLLSQLVELFTIVTFFYYAQATREHVNNYRKNY